MNIGVVHWAFQPVIGGVETHLLTIYPEVARRGASASVLCGTVEGAPDDEEIEGVHVARRAGMSPDEIEAVRAGGGDVYAASRAMFEDFLDAHGAEVVHAHNLHMDYFDLSRALLDSCRERGIPALIVLHNHEFIDRDWEETRRIITELDWDRYVPISEFVLGQMRATCPEVPEDKWLVIRHGIDLERFRPRPPDEIAGMKAAYGFTGRRVILHPARLLPWKGVLPAVKSMPAVCRAEPDALLVQTGRAGRVYKEPGELERYERAIEAFIAENDLKGHVHIGEYGYEDMPLLTALSDVVIYPTIGDEPFGLVPVEGMACQKPVIVTRSGGLVESVIDGVTGFVIERDEKLVPSQLAEHVIRLLGDQSLARRMGQAGLARAHDRFGRERMARDFLDLSRRLLDERG
jgi:glycosyltransferase involved in cell wall biosynthesis